MLKTIKNILDRTLETLIIVSMAVLTIDVCWQVFTRLVLKNPGIWTEELATFMIVWVALLGSAVALSRGAHLGIDYLVNKLSIRNKIFTEIFVFFCIAMFSLCVMVIGGMDLVITTLNLGQISPGLGVKIGYVYLAIPLSGLFLVLYSVIGLVERLTALFKHSYTSEQKTLSADEQVGAY
jgi:TRAP-type C4-dicarboxylate transport system permease small subunit